MTQRENEDYKKKNNLNLQYTNEIKTNQSINLDDDSYIIDNGIIYQDKNKIIYYDNNSSYSSDKKTNQ